MSPHPPQPGRAWSYICKILATPSNANRVETAYHSHWKIPVTPHAFFAVKPLKTFETIDKTAKLVFEGKVQSKAWKGKGPRRPMLLKLARLPHRPGASSRCRCLANQSRTVLMP